MGLQKCKKDFMTLTYARSYLIPRLTAWACTRSSLKLSFSLSPSLSDVLSEIERFRSPADSGNERDLLCRVQKRNDALSIVYDNIFEEQI